MPRGQILWPCLGLGTYGLGLEGPVFGLGLGTYGIGTYVLGLEGPVFGLGLGHESCIDNFFGFLASPSNLNKLLIVIIVN